MRIIILTEAEIRECVRLDSVAEKAVEEAFTALAEKRAITPLMSIPVAEHNGEMHVKSAVINGVESFAVKIASGFFDNPSRGLPSGSGLMMLFSAETGFPQAVLLDNGYLTHTRTGAAGTIVARHLAPEQITTAGIIGAGRQGRVQLRALRIARDFSRALVYDLDQDKAAAYANVMSAELGIDVAAADDPESLVRACQVIVTATPSREPIIRAEWLQPGTHITAMGADNGHKQELFPEVLGKADRLVCDLRQQVFRLGEHRFAVEAGAISEDAPVDELGEITAGVKPGRTSPDEITVCDLTGVGTQDTVIARLAYQSALEKGMGLAIEA